MLDERRELLTERPGVLLVQVHLILRAAYPEPHRLGRRASIKIKHLWSEIKDVLKETHEGLNQAYEVYYGPFRIPQESERRMS